jgi:hypothetical protein
MYKKDSTGITNLFRAGRDGFRQKSPETRHYSTSMGGVKR